MFYIGFDLQSSSVKATLIEANTGKSVGMAQCPENDNLFCSEICSNTSVTLVRSDISVIDTAGAVGAVRDAG